MAKEQDITRLIEKTIHHLGCELWGCEYVAQGKHSIVRIYIDKEGGVGAEDCAEVSHQVSGLLDVEDIIPSSYHLEVSSPGLERALFKLEHYKKYIGQLAQIRLRTPLAGRRKFKGTLSEVQGEKITLVTEEGVQVLDFNNIEKAHLVVNI